jgi:signal transduction histidine kinase
VLKVTRRPDEVWVAVQDNGIGIPKPEQMRIFDRFYQVEPHLTRRHEGLGIGLTVARDLLDIQSGRIWVKSKEGKGSTFTFALPLSQAANNN